MDELLGEFISETLETLEVLSSEVVAWEADPADHTRLDAFFRFFHTVKGSCGFLDLPRFLRLSHGAEDVLAAVRSGERKADPATVSGVLAIMDRIGLLARAVADGLPLPDDDDDQLIAALHSRQVAAEAHSGPGGRGEIDQPRSRAAAPRTIRLPLMLIDQLMNGVSDMVLARNELSRKMRESQTDAEMESSFERLSTCVADLRDIISKTRMQRVDRLYAAIPRMVRDLGRELGRKVAVELDGGDVEMDREMIEMVVDPLTHIVRNAIDHGIEPPVKRLAAGKPETGLLRIQARQSGNQICIEISDDGNGINRAGLVDKALARRVITAEQARTMSPEEQVQLIFEPGLSTAKSITAISGRGVGMDVVRANVEQIGGTIGIESVEGKGTTFFLRVPLTLTIIPGLIVRSGRLHFAIPRGNVVELLHDNNAMVKVERVAQGAIATIRGARYSMIDLEDALELPQPHAQEGSDGQSQRTLLVIRSAACPPYVLAVEAVENIEELVIRPASPLVTASGLYAGMTLPDHGQPMLLLDVAGIAHDADLPGIAGGTAAVAAASTEDVAARHEVQALRFVALDGKERLIPLAVVDRVEDVPAGSFGASEGRAFVQLDGQVVPSACLPPQDETVLCCLRLRAGDELLCYPVRSVADILMIGEEVDLPSCQDESIAGIVLVDGHHFELVDPYALFAQAARPARVATPTSSLTCLIADDGDPWMTTMLVPLLRQAGHVVLSAPQEGRKPDIILGSEAAPVPDQCPLTPLLRLRKHPLPTEGDQNSIYRYDRDAVLAALRTLARSEAA